MSLATRCNSCQTAFKVVQDQLKVSDGWVRCGHCGTVFNARQSLFEISPEVERASSAAPQPSTQAPSQPASQAATPAPAQPSAPAASPSAPSASAAMAAASEPVAAAARTAVSRSGTIVPDLSDPDPLPEPHLKPPAEPKAPRTEASAAHPVKAQRDAALAQDLSALDHALAQAAVAARPEDPPSGLISNRPPAVSQPSRDPIGSSVVPAPQAPLSAMGDVEPVGDLGLDLAPRGLKEAASPPPSAQIDLGDLPQASPAIEPATPQAVSGPHAVSQASQAMAEAGETLSTKPAPGVVADGATSAGSSDEPAAPRPTDSLPIWTEPDELALEAPARSALDPALDPALPVPSPQTSLASAPADRPEADSSGTLSTATHRLPSTDGPGRPATDEGLIAAEAIAGVEVAELDLDDLDWHAPAVHVPSSPALAEPSATEATPADWPADLSMDQPASLSADLPDPARQADRPDQSGDPAASAHDESPAPAMADRLTDSVPQADLPPPPSTVLDDRHALASTGAPDEAPVHDAWTQGVVGTQPALPVHPAMVSEPPEAEAEAETGPAAEPEPSMWASSIASIALKGARTVSVPAPPPEEMPRSGSLDALPAGRWAEGFARGPRSHVPVIPAFADTIQVPLSDASLRAMQAHRDDPSPAAAPAPEEEVTLSMLDSRFVEDGDHEALAAMRAKRQRLAGQPSPSAPSFVREAERRARWRHPAVRAALAAGTLLGAGALLLQAAWLNPDAMQLNWPWVAQAIQPLSTAMGHPLPLPRQIEALNVESVNVVARPDASDVYDLQLRLRHRGEQAVELPALELTLTDVQGQVLARKVLPVKDFPGAPAQFNAKTELPLQTTLTVEGGQVAGYTVSLFYP